MKKILTLALIYSLFAVGAQAQCTIWGPADKGTKTEMTSYDAKGKVTGKSKQELVNIATQNGDTHYTIESEYFDKKDRSSGKNTMEFICQSDGTFVIDMKSIAGSAAAVEGTKITMKNLVYPQNLKVGTTLEDAEVEFGVEMEGSPFQIPPTKIVIKDQKVVAKETVSTPAGTFDCYKIQQTTSMKLPMVKEVVLFSYCWISKDVGTVKTEAYKSEGGDLVSSSVLTKLEK